MNWYKFSTIRDDLRNKYPQLTIWLTEEPDKIILNDLRARKEMRGQGFGTSFMKDLIEYSKKVNKPIYLTPETSSGKNRLISWYEGLGFKDKPKSDFSVRHTMKRLPV
jgi:GNAT superfamily N-acetyltransferase